MPVVSVINYKGGVGKTTLTANLAAELAFRGSRVLMMDMDAQASLTFSFVKPEEWQKNLSAGGTILDWYTSHEEGVPIALSSLIMRPDVKRYLPYNGTGRLDLIPSHLGLINVDLELATQLGGGTLKQTKHKYLTVHSRLREELEDAAFDNYDIILIDCPPNFNVVTKTAIVASDQILIPAKADYLSTLGIDYLQRSLNELVNDYNAFAGDEPSGGGDYSKIDPEILGVVFTMVQFYAQQPVAASRVFINEAKKLGVPVFKKYMRENKTYHADAPQYGRPLTLDRSAGARNLVRELEELTVEFVKRARL